MINTGLSTGLFLIDTGISKIDPFAPAPATTLLAPKLLTAPAITGTVLVGSILTVSNGAWESLEDVIYTYQWKAGGSNIAGATSSTYTLTNNEAGKAITCTVTATNAAGGTSSTTAATGLVGRTPSNTTAPTITGTARVGQTLTVNNGVWAGYPAPAYSYQWKANGTNITGATSATFVLTATQAGQVITCTVTATNSVGNASVTTAATAAVTMAPTNSAVPTISGTVRVGQTLTATAGTWSGYPAPTYSYQWQRGTTNISGATSSTYVPVIADAGQTLRVVVTATNSVSAVSANSASTVAVTMVPANTVAPVLSGTPTVGETLTVTDGTWTGFPAPTFAYTWKADGVAIAGASGNSFTLTEDEVGATITVDVVGTNSVGNATATSNGLGPVEAVEEPIDP